MIAAVHGCRRVLEPNRHPHSATCRERPTSSRPPTRPRRPHNEHGNNRPCFSSSSANRPTPSSSTASTRWSLRPSVFRTILSTSGRSSRASALLRPHTEVHERARAHNPVTQFSAQILEGSPFLQRHVSLAELGDHLVLPRQAVLTRRHLLLGVLLAAARTARGPAHQVVRRPLERLPLPVVPVVEDTGLQVHLLADGCGRHLASARRHSPNPIGGSVLSSSRIPCR